MFVSRENVTTQERVIPAVHLTSLFPSQQQSLAFKVEGRNVLTGCEALLLHWQRKRHGIP